MDLTTDLDVIRRRERIDPIDNRRLRRALDDRTWTRVAPGAFVLTTHWRSLDPLERHRLRVTEVARRLRGPVVFSHFAAAALWRIDVLGAWPELVDVSCPSASGGRSSGVVRRRTRIMAGVETVSCGMHAVTTPAQTALDLARSEAFVRGVSIVDQALWKARPEGALTDLFEIVRLWESQQDRRGVARAERAISFASPLAANVRESQARVVVAELGFPTPRLQERRVLPGGRVAYADLCFPEQDHWCEIDGRAKYRDPVFLDGRTPEQAVIDEKNRENEIRREVHAFSRWEAADADHPRRIYDILTRDGLPSTRPRP
ncbi:hypothetical protein AB1K54_05460 [Microbacterium sp. BWT-B31]|uniref:hypothetical protein n=1 Tax=Microbacterium sp. BWT-B31 TaxID=3232072 RepID=UPI003529A1A9